MNDKKKKEKHLAIYWGGNITRCYVISHQSWAINLILIVSCEPLMANSDLK
jgi:hypothetical protein